MKKKQLLGILLAGTMMVEQQFRFLQQMVTE